MTSTTFLVSVQNHADFNVQGICTASVMFSRMIGSALGTAVMGAVLNLNLQLRLPHAQDPVQQIMSQETRDRLAPDVLQPMLQAIAASLHWVFIVALVIACLTLWVAWKMPRQQPQQTE